MIPKTPRIRLSPPKYRKLCEAVLERDVYCQGCGGVGTDFHHRVFKSHGGDDTMGNLILMCRACHMKCHGINVAKN